MSSGVNTPTRPGASFGSTMAANTLPGGQESSASPYQAEAARFDSLKSGSLQSQLPVGASDAGFAGKAYGHQSTDSNTMPANQDPEGGFEVHRPDVSSYSAGSRSGVSSGSTAGFGSGSGSSLKDKAADTYQRVKNTASDLTNQASNKAQQAYDEMPSTGRMQAKARGSGSSLEDKAHRYVQSAVNHPTVQQVTKTTKQLHRQYIQPATDKLLSEQTQQQLQGKMQRLGRVVRNLRDKYDRSFVDFGRDVVHTSATPTVLTLITSMVTLELVLPLFYFNQPEARVVMAAAIGTIMGCHAIWYALGGQIRPLVLGGFAVQLPMFLYLFFSGGLGGGYASELALAIDAAQRSVKHAGAIATLSNYYFIYLVWVRAVMVGSAVVLSHAAPAIRDDMIAYRRGQVATGTLNTTSSLQQHSAAGRAGRTDSEYTEDRTTAHRDVPTSHSNAGGSNTIPSGRSTQTYSGADTGSSLSQYLPSQETMSNAATTASNIASSVASTASDLASRAINSASQSLPSQSRVNEMTQQAKDTAQDTLQSAKDKAQETSSRLGNKASQVSGQISDKASEVSDRASHHANRAYEQAPSTNDLKSQAQSAAQTVTNKASELTQRASDKASELGNAASQQAHRAYEQAPSTSELKSHAQRATNTASEKASQYQPSTTSSSSYDGSSRGYNQNGDMNALTKDETVIGTGSSYGRSTGDSNTQPPEQDPTNFTVHAPSTTTASSGRDSNFGSTAGASSASYTSPFASESRRTALPTTQVRPLTGAGFRGAESSSDYTSQEPSATSSYQSHASAASYGSLQPSASEHKYYSGNSSSSGQEGSVNDTNTSTTFALNPMVSDVRNATPDQHYTTTQQAVIVDNVNVKNNNTRTGTQIKMLPYED